MTENTHVNVGEISDIPKKEFIAGSIIRAEDDCGKRQCSLYEFISSFVQRNTLVRLWKEDEYAYTYKMILMEEKHEDGTPRECCMEWEILSNRCSHAKYINCNVLGVTDIICDNNREAVNIVIDPDDKVSHYRFYEEHDFCRG